MIFNCYTSYTSCRKQLIDVAAATQTPAAHAALMQLITFTDESAIDYPERFILASAYTTHPGEYHLPSAVFTCAFLGASCLHTNDSLLDH